MENDTNRKTLIKLFEDELERLVAFADAENEPVLAAKLEDARLIFHDLFVRSTDLS